MVLKPIVIGFVHFPLKLPPLGHAAKLELGIDVTVQTKMPEFMRKGEAITVQEPLQDKLIDGDAGQVARYEPVDLKEVAQTRQGDDIEAALYFSDLLNRRRNRALRMKLTKELLGFSSDVVIRKTGDADFNRSAPFESIPRVDRVSPE